jgi:RNA exonuclease 4
MVNCENSQELARLSIVNYNGHVLFDEYIRPVQRITNFVTWVSGIKPHHLKDAKTFEEHKTQIYRIMKDKLIVGHSLHSDFKQL